MSTPERQEDPGEYGYGSAKQDLPEDERADEAGQPSADDEQPSGPDDEPEPAA
jgi:hypothetical protein